MRQGPEYDYVVVGGGSAGCIVAARLAEEKKGTVLLLESGEPTENNPETMTAEGFKYAFANDHVMWDRMSYAQQSCSRRSIYVGTGTGMGGSGSVNGMVYTRGDKLDFEQWPEGWQWDDIAPAFSAVEDRLRVRPRAPTRFTEIGIEAAKQVGFQKKDHLNDGHLCGFLGYNDMNYEGDTRRSSYASFIHAQALDLLTVKTNSIVHRVVFDDDKVARSVEFETHGIKQSVTVAKEVILCAGALETPKLLMLSGVGPKQEFARFGIPLVLDMPEIGQNLHDHPNVCLFFKGKQKVDFGHPQVYGFDRSNNDLPLPEGQADTCYTYLAAPITLKQSMYRMLPALALPGKWFYNQTLRSLFRKLIDLLFFLPKVEKFVDQIYGIVVILGKPQSKGQLRLASNNVKDQAVIDPAYYSDPADMKTMLSSVEVAKRIASQQGLQEWGNKALVPAAKTDDKKQIEQWIKGATMTTFHFSGTCRMGSDEGAPVDTSLKLKGIKNLRIADASIIPEIPVSAINAPSMMIGYRAAEFIISESENNSELKVAKQ